MSLFPFLFACWCCGSLFDFEPGLFLRHTHLSLCLYSLLLFHPFHSELLNADVRSTRIAAKGQKTVESRAASALASSCRQSRAAVVTAPRRAAPSSPPPRKSAWRPAAPRWRRLGLRAWRPALRRTQRPLVHHRLKAVVGRCRGQCGVVGRQWSSWWCCSRRGCSSWPPLQHVEGRLVGLVGETRGQAALRCCCRARPPARPWWPAAAVARGAMAR